MPEIETASLALSTDLATAREVQALCDAEAGYPRDCLCADGSEPPPGVPRTILHAQDPEPIMDKDQKATGWVHPLPRKPLPLALAAKVQAKTPTEIAALKAEAAPVDLEEAPIIR